MGLWKQYGVCLQGTGVPGEASQDGPEQKENKHRSDESVVTPRNREKSTFVLGGQGKQGLGGREEAHEEDSGWERRCFGPGAWAPQRRPGGALWGGWSHCLAFWVGLGNHFLSSAPWGWPERRHHMTVSLRFRREDGSRGLP